MSAWPSLSGPQVTPRRADQLRAQGGGVDPADGTLLVLEEASVEGQPLAGRVLDLAPDHGVGVELRVGLPAGVLAEQRSHKALGIDLVNAVLASSGDPAVVLQPVQCGDHGGVVGGQ